MAEALFCNLLVIPIVSSRTMLSKILPFWSSSWSFSNNGSYIHLVTVDPVLAQGFTMAMESGASLANSIEHSLISSSTCVYEPKFLRETLNHRYSCRERRLLQLLRSTELVQRMAQPQGTLASIFATWIVRPLIKLSPAILKKKVFDFLIRYSLGLAGMGDHGIELGSNKPLSNRLQRHLWIFWWAGIEKLIQLANN